MTTRDRFPAMRLSTPGGALELHPLEPARPESDDDVLVRMAYAGVNPVDSYVRAGTVGDPNLLPRTLGVEGVGESGGQWYVVHGGGIGVARDGTWAEYVVAPRDALVPVPAGLDLELAACAGVVGATAVRVTCDLADVTKDDRVLVLGAAGGVGTAVTSVALSRGADVWGQVGDPAKADVVVDGWAEPVVAATPDELRELVAGLGITVAFDALGGGYTGVLVESLAPHGRLISYGVAAGPRSELPMQALYRKNITVRGYGGVAEPEERVRSAIGRALDQLAAADMKIPVDRVVPLDRAEEALEDLKARRVRGKVLLDTRTVEEWA
ncbi:zinc-binding alcohol dehydrogenase family protein [Lentzea rhizosphaerae]|uniref:Zinc-binding alcohol dehydrogenase family protein n=1 Tax=Lentzea rhizosphaerae TaxID=2041025 RepID=A0ABV8C890_9PSEU